MDGGARWAAVHGVAKSRTRLCYFTFHFSLSCLEKEMATHSSVLAWRISGTGEPGGLPSMGSHRVGHDWSDLAQHSIWFKLVFPYLKRSIMYYHQRIKFSSLSMVLMALNSTLSALSFLFLIIPIILHDLLYSWRLNSVHFLKHAIVGTSDL